MAGVIVASQRFFMLKCIPCQNRFVLMASLPYLISLLFIFTVSSAEDDNVTIVKGATEFDGGILIYANFVPFLNHKLNISPVEDSRMVRDEGDCIAACTEKVNCRSVNFNTSSDVNGKHSCQILDNDKFVSHDSFIPSLEFHLFSFTAPCEHNPCKRGGTCYPKNSWKDFKCECPSGVQGKTCDEVLYRTCAELLAAGIRNTGSNTIIDKNWVVPTYCDQEYLGGGWTLVFKVVAGSSCNPQEIWPARSSLNVARAEVINVDFSEKHCYRSRYVKAWQNRSPTQVRVALYDKKSELLSIVFDATGSDRENWFAKNRLIHSPWADLENETQNFFSLLGDLTTGRAFYINKVNDSCHGDIGWLMASTGKLCDYESRHKELNLMYSKLGTSVNWNEHEDVGIADVLVVFLR